jgi:SAM-dependent methyltransferase
LKRLALRKVLRRLGLADHDVSLRLGGPFALQGNNDTRTVEYPWAFAATPLGPGLDVVEIGGALSGFQFALAKAGCRVVNVDPGDDDEYWGLSLPMNRQTMGRLNRVFRTDVDLRVTTIQSAGLGDASADRVFSISVVEHFPEQELAALAREIHRVLRPGGMCVLTIDLFLDLDPFTSKQSNEYGRNTNVRELVEATGLELIVGDRAELVGYDEFDAQSILMNLSEYYIGSGYPVCAQALVLAKP